MTTAHESFDREDGVFGIGDLLVTSGLSDQAVSLVRESDHRRGGSITGGVDDDCWLATFHHRNDGVGGAEIDSNDFGHV
jgi:hypothetical protein